MQTQPLVNQYLDECERRDLSPKTLEQRRWALQRLISDCPNLPSRDAELLPVLSDTELAIENHRDLEKCLRTFFRRATRRYQVENPTLDLGPLPYKMQLRRVMTRQEVMQLLSAAHTRRDRALILVIMDCGLRLGEVAGLRYSDLRDGWLTVHGKIGARQVPVSPGVSTELDAIAIGHHLWHRDGEALSFDGVKTAYRRLFRRAGILGPKLGAHTLRHTFATMYIRAGGGARQLQSILGHSKLENTMIYVHLAGTDVRENHALYWPVRTLSLAEHL